MRNGPSKAENGVSSAAAAWLSKVSDDNWWHFSIYFPTCGKIIIWKARIVTMRLLLLCLPYSPFCKIVLSLYLASKSLNLISQMNFVYDLSKLFPVILLNHSVWKSPKMSHFEFWHFPPIFVVTNIMVYTMKSMYMLFLRPSCTTYVVPARYSSVVCYRPAQ